MSKQFDSSELEELKVDNNTDCEMVWAKVIIQGSADLYIGFIYRPQTKATKNTYNVSKGAKIRNRYNQIPHLTQDTNGKVTNSQLDTTNESQEVSPFPTGDHKSHINRRAQRHSKHKIEQKHKRSTKEVPPWNGQ